mmetsp:Transcript_16788/g.25336  ORF Transcript_16788/g.25336 Transcript_16788/m.25336 type:complete len:87 (+) Transcript_16788:1826-2086(+)
MWIIGGKQIMFDNDCTLSFLHAAARQQYCFRTKSERMFVLFWTLCLACICRKRRSCQRVGLSLMHVVIHLTRHMYCTQIERSSSRS